MLRNKKLKIEFNSMVDVYKNFHQYIADGNQYIQNGNLVFVNNVGYSPNVIYFKRLISNYRNYFDDVFSFKLAQRSTSGQYLRHKFSFLAVNLKNKPIFMVEIDIYNIYGTDTTRVNRIFLRHTGIYHNFNNEITLYDGHYIDLTQYYNFEIKNLRKNIYQIILNNSLKINFSLIRKNLKLILSKNVKHFTKQTPDSTSLSFLGICNSYNFIYSNTGYLDYLSLNKKNNHKNNLFQLTNNTCFYANFFKNYRKQIKVLNFHTI